jgi:hypothetical protein
MKLRFLAARDALVHERHADGSSMQHAIGVPDRFVGRAYDAKLRGYPATREPYECNDGTGEAEYLKRECRVGDLHAADEATAKACGVELASVEFQDGVWVPKASAPVSKKFGSAQSAQESV